MDLLGTLRGDFENLAYDLLASEPAPRLTEAAPSLMLLTFPAGNRVALFKYAAGPGEDAQTVARLKKAAQLGIDEIVLVGGPPGAAKLLDPARSVFRRGVKLVHVEDPPRLDPAISGLGRGSSSALGKILRAGIRGAPSDEAFSAAVQRGIQRQRALSAETQEFAQTLQHGKPIATYAIAASIIAMFLLESALGGSEKTQVLVRLGALVPSRLREEPWRLFSAAFLHIGFVHLLLNTYVLVMIGRMLERIIGTWRFLVIYWIAVLCGSLMSAWVSHAGLEAGASGGVIGLLAAESALAFVPRGLLPQEVLPGMRRAAMTNLIINVVNSLRPGIPLTAHLGGALAGAALIFLPFFTAGLPRLGEPAPEGQSKADRLPGWTKPLAILGVALMAVSVGFALARGGAFELGRGVTWSATAIGQTGLSVALPATFEPHPLRVTQVSGDTRTEASFGDLPEDGAQLTVLVIDLASPFSDDALPSQLANLQASFGKSKGGFEVIDAPHIVRRGGRDLVVSAEKRDELTYERAGLVSATRMVIVSALYQGDGAGMRHGAERVLGSISGL